MTLLAGERRPGSAPGDPERPWRFAVLDVETTGLEPETSRVVEIAVVEIDRAGAVLGEFSTLVRIPGEGELGATAIHGLTRLDLLGAPRFGELAPLLAARLEGRVVVGHVVAFDLGHLGAEFARAGRPWPVLSDASICTKELASTILPEGSRSLRSCCAASGVAAPVAHRALPDARATAALFVRLLDRLGEDRAASAWASAQQVTWPTHEGRRSGEGGSLQLSTGWLPSMPGDASASNPHRPSSSQGDREGSNDLRA